jgi:mRNA-degrading endonuclease RelE of RelBE toxin-antitoxin system
MPRAPAGVDLPVVSIETTLILVAKRKAIFAPDAVRQFRQLSAAERSRLKEAIKTSLVEDDATVANRNRFPLRRPSEHASFEFRAGELRVFYRVMDNEVRIVLIGRKKGNQLFVDGKRFAL